MKVARSLDPAQDLALLKKQEASTSCNLWRITAHRLAGLIRKDHDMGHDLAYGRHP